MITYGFGNFIFVVVEIVNEIFFIFNIRRVFQAKIFFENKKILFYFNGFLKDNKLSFVPSRISFCLL